MYRVEDSQLSVYDFVPPFSGSLDRTNRWVRLAESLDWPALEKAYAGNFAAGGKDGEMSVPSSSGSSGGCAGCSGGNCATCGH